MVEQETYDLVIVGAGVAGALIAARLAAAGAKVAMLDSGPRVNRQDAVNRYRAAIAKTPECPYPGTDWAPRPDSLNLDLYYVQTGPSPSKAPTSAASAVPLGTGSAPPSACCRATSR